MTGPSWRAGGVAAWLLAILAVAGHAVLAALAVTEFAEIGWPLPASYDTVNVTIVLAAAATGLAAAGNVMRRAAAGGRALRTLVRQERSPVPEPVRAAAAELGLAGRLDAVSTTDAFALTHGLLRPRIVVSTALAAELGAAEIVAVLAHEREHLRRRDPLHLLAARLLAAWAWYLPAARWLAERVALRRELAADRASASCASRGVLAGALLKLASRPAHPAVAAARSGPDEPGSLQARVAQLEGARPPRPRLALPRMLMSVGGLAVFGAAGTCCAALSQFLPPGTL